MRHPRTTRRTGAALPIALAALIIVLPATVALARLATTHRLQVDFDAATEVADDLMLATEAPILHWLDAESAGVVLPADARAPVLVVLDDELAVDDLTIEVRITAWDQCGMVPLAQTRSPLFRSILPDEVIRTLREVQIPSQDPAGLDHFAPARPFPRFAPGDDGPLALGALVATHNDVPGTINVNTAPLPLVEAALRQAGRGGIDLIIAAREQGERAVVGSLLAETEPHASSIRLSGRSTVWAFRIDTRVGPIRKSWWAVYVRGSSPGSSSNWRCEQRLVITT